MIAVVNEAGRNLPDYRFVPANQIAKQLIDRGKLGSIYHFRGRFLQDWPLSADLPATWRLDKTAAGSGTLGDLGSRVIDLTHYLVRDIAVVAATAKTFMLERAVSGSNVQSL